MKINNLNNNFSLNAIVILMILKKKRRLKITEAILVLPFISKSNVINYISKPNVSIKSLEQLIAYNPDFISNFNNLFYNCISESLNTIMFLEDIGLIKLERNKIILKKEQLDLGKNPGKRLFKINKSLDNLINIISGDKYETYLNLRVQL